MVKRTSSRKQGKSQNRDPLAYLHLRRTHAKVRKKALVVHNRKFAEKEWPFNVVKLYQKVFSKTDVNRNSNNFNATFVKCFSMNEKTELHSKTSFSY